jgi:hypothetical protein
MYTKSVLVCTAAVAISLVAATYRFRDSGHAVGMLGIQGGKARHAVQLDPGKGRYVLVVTGVVQPPYRGNARVELEGTPEMDYELHLSRPVVDLGLHRAPRLSGGVLEDLRPKDKFALWVIMRPKDRQGFSAMSDRACHHTLVFHDTESGKSLLRVPVTYHQPDEENCHAE